MTPTFRRAMTLGVLALVVIVVIIATLLTGTSTL